MKYVELQAILYEERAGVSNRYAKAAYDRVIKILGAETGQVSRKRIAELPLTGHMKEKLTRFLDEKRRPDPEKVLRLELSTILGLGEKKIDELIAAGLTNTKHLSQARWSGLLNADTLAIIRHKPLRQIPHEEIRKIQKVLEWNGAQLVGSFRRQKSFSRDIDVLVMSADKDALKQYAEHLAKYFETTTYAVGDDKMSVIIEVGPATKDRGISRVFKLDAFRCTPDEYWTHLLYSTGSKEFNVRMRARAKRMGLLLNQRGLFRDGQKINSPDDDERALFAMVDMEYVEPWYR